MIGTNDSLGITCFGCLSSIQLEFENNYGDYLEVELFEDGRLKEFFYGQDGKTEIREIRIESIAEEIARFHCT